MPLAADGRDLEVPSQRDIEFGFDLRDLPSGSIGVDGAIGEAGDSLFKGPVAIAFAPDPVSAAKVATQYAKDNDKFSVVGGFMGQQVLDKTAVTALATLPSLDQLRAKLIGLIQAPATKVAGVLQAPAGQLARVFNAYATKDAA